MDGDRWNKKKTIPGSGKENKKYKDRKRSKEYKETEIAKERDKRIKEKRRLELEEKKKEEQILNELFEKPKPMEVEFTGNTHPYPIWLEHVRKKKSQTRILIGEKREKGF